MGKYAGCTIARRVPGPRAPRAPARRRRVAGGDARKTPSRGVQEGLGGGDIGGAPQTGWLVGHAAAKACAIIHREGGATVRGPTVERRWSVRGSCAGMSRVLRRWALSKRRPIPAANTAVLDEPSLGFHRVGFPAPLPATSTSRLEYRSDVIMRLINCRLLLPGCQNGIVSACPGAR